MNKIVEHLLITLLLIHIAFCNNATLLWNMENDNQCTTSFPFEVSCAVNGSLLLKSEFKRLFEAYPNQTHYERLIVENNAIFTELPDDVFMGLRFGNIFLNSAPNLTRIHRNAFASTFSTTVVFTISTINQLRDYPPEFDLYYALSTLTDATRLQITLDPSPTVSHLIPENAFRNINGVQFRLVEISFEGKYKISQIGSKAFYEIPFLQKLVFKETAIASISSRAFDFPSSYEIPLEIDLTGCELTDQSLDSNIFSDAKRTLIVNLSNNSLNYLDESIFSSFLAADNRNQLYLFGNYLNCTDIDRFIWLLKQRDQLESRVNNAQCFDGTNFWETELPPTTTISIPTISSSITTVLIPTTTTLPIILCNHDNSYNGQYDIDFWPRVRPGEISYGQCRFGFVGIGMWLCGNDSKFDNKGPTINCTQDWIEDLYVDIIDANITDINEVTNYTNILNGELINNDVKYFAELLKITEMVEKLQSFSNNIIDSNQYLNETKIIAENSVGIFSNLLNQSRAWVYANETEKTKLSEQIVLQTQYTSFLFGCQLNTNNIKFFNTNNIYVEIFQLNETGYVFKSSKTNSSIIIPPNVDIPLNNLPHFCPLRTSFAVLFERIDQYFFLNLSDSEKFASNIIGFSFTNDTKTHKLNDGLKAKIILEHYERLNFGDKIRCSYWNFETQNWASDGCERIANESNRDITTCECNHLTNFAAILDIKGRERNGDFKSMLTIICSWMSCICLILTLFVIIISKIKKRKHEKSAEFRDFVTTNLCICLFTVNIIILFGMDLIKNAKWLCQLSSGLLLYALLSAFCWMLLEGIILYKNTIKIFHDYYRYVKLVNFIFAYGTPIIVLIASFTILSFTNEDYAFKDFAVFDVLFKDNSTNYFCWISSEQNWQNILIFATPASLILMINLCIVIVSLCRVCGKVNCNFWLIILYSAFVCYMGIAWLLFILYNIQFGDYFAYFSYIFIVINGTQGVFIFLFQIIITARTVSNVLESSDGVKNTDSK